jgi:hypothetical protein
LLPDPIHGKLKWGVSLTASLASDCEAFFPTQLG